MGFNISASSATLIARLTPYGRERLLSGNLNVITKFSLGDSDANYYTSALLGTGEVPNMGGIIGTNGNFSNSTTEGLGIKYPINFNPTTLFKPIKAVSTQIVKTSVKFQQVVIGSTGLTTTLINRNNTSASSTNLFASFGLPITTTDKQYFESLTNSNGGFADTALSGLNQDNAIVIGLDQQYYGEEIDGKSIKLSLGVYDIYGTFQKSNKSVEQQDANFRQQPTTNALKIGNPIVMLFSDSIQKPNNESGKSWSTGYAQLKPFSVGGKNQFNYITTTSLSQVKDKAVGVAYLDKGFMVITDPTIVAAASASTPTLTFRSVSTDVVQNITCIKDNNEFVSSRNSTFSNGDIIRMTELGLYDVNDRLIALAKSDRQLELAPYDFLAFSVKISV